MSALRSCTKSRSEQKATHKEHLTPWKPEIKNIFAPERLYLPFPSFFSRVHNCTYRSPVYYSGTVVTKCLRATLV